MDPFLLIVACLAVYRLSLLLSTEDGPAWLFRKIRRLPPPKSSARQGISCLLCVSVYFSGAVTWFLWWLDKIPTIETPLYWLALSAGAIVIHMHTTKGL